MHDPPRLDEASELQRLSVAAVERLVGRFGTDAIRRRLLIIADRNDLSSRRMVIQLLVTVDQLSALRTIVPTRHTDRKHPLRRRTDRTG